MRLAQLIISLGAGLFFASVTLAEQVCQGAKLTRPDSRYESGLGGLEVKDTVSGLIWRRCVEGLQWDGKQCAGEAIKVGLNEAQELAKKAATATKRAWRLPTHAEMHSLAEKACKHPAINAKWFPETPQAMHWSFLAEENNGKNPFLVDFASGEFANWINKSPTNYVRLVRNP
ncbi:DUF1566 domain-containing protein [Parvibium lacunae]|nr:DUF1566 domain-containing protein [Parvibium lacunae]